MNLEFKKWSYMAIKAATVLYLLWCTLSQYWVTIGTATGPIGILPDTYQAIQSFYAILFDNPALWLGIIVAIFYDLFTFVVIGLILEILLWISHLSFYLRYPDVGLLDQAADVIAIILLSLFIFATIKLKRTRPDMSKMQIAASPGYRRVTQGIGVLLAAIVILQLIQYIYIGGFMWVMSSWDFWVAQTMYVLYFSYFIFTFYKHPRPVIVYLILMIPMTIYGCLMGLGIATLPDSTSLLCKVQGVIFGLLAILAVYHWVRDFIL